MGEARHGAIGSRPEAAQEDVELFKERIQTLKTAFAQAGGMEN